jgi:hypothetical protein
LSRYAKARIGAVVLKDGEADETVRMLQATGYKRPNLGFLPTQKLFRGAKTPSQYAPPNLFLQHFAASDWSCLMTNAGYYEGLGTVGHNHIGRLSNPSSTERK